MTCAMHICRTRKPRYGGRLTVLVNNAGMAYKGSTFGAQEARITMDTNYFGTAGTDRVETHLGIYAMRGLCGLLQLFKGWLQDY